MSFRSASRETLAKLGYPSEKLYETSFGVVEAIIKGQPEKAFNFIADQELAAKDVIAFLEKALTVGVVPARSISPVKHTIAVLKKHYKISLSRQEQIMTGGTTSSINKTYLLIGGGLVVAYLLFK